MIDEQKFDDAMNKSMGIAIKIGELVQGETLGVGVMALQSSLKAILLCAPAENRNEMVAAIMMFLSADIFDFDQIDQSIH